MSTPLRLIDLPATGRLALTLLLFVVLGGFGASGAYLRDHHQNRDERAGLSLTDLEGAYHGVRTRSPLLLALEANHPAEIEGHEALPADQQEVLLKWLNNNSRLSEDYDNLDLGENAPAEILAASCLSCHSRNSQDEAGKQIPLDYWDDVKKLAISRDIAPTDESILLASTHTHAIALSTISIVIVFLMMLTRWPAGMRGGLALLAALGLSIDLASWWLARSSPMFVYGVVGGGAAFVISIALMTLAVLVDLWWPRRAG